MALLQNIVSLSQYPLKQRGAILTQEKCFFGRLDTQQNKYCGETTGMDQKCGVPDGYSPPTAWNMPVKEGGMSSYVTLTGEGTATFVSLSKGVALTAPAGNLLGTGTFTAGMGVIIQLAAALAGDSSLSASMLASLRMEASLAGLGDLSAELSLIAWCVSQLSGAGSADGSVLRGDSYMSSEITSAGELVTADSCARAVWESIADRFVESGTFGQKLNAASVGGVDYDALAVAVWEGAPEQTDPWTKVIDGTYTAEDILRIVAGALAGKLDGAGTTLIKIRNLADTKDLVTAVVDSKGNRITVDVLP